MIASVPPVSPGRLPVRSSSHIGCAIVQRFQLAQDGASSIQRICSELRGTKGAETSDRRIALESELAEKAGVSAGQVLIYCPSSEMQAKEVDLRIELNEGTILPLRTQAAEFVFQEDVKIIGDYYKQLWRAYVFVAPEVYKNREQSRRIVQAFAKSFGMDEHSAYKKMRAHSADQERSEAEDKRAREPAPSAPGNEDVKVWEFGKQLQTAVFEGVRRQWGGKLEVDDSELPRIRQYLMSVAGDPVPNKKGREERLLRELDAKLAELNPGGITGSCG